MVRKRATLFRLEKLKGIHVMLVEEMRSDFSNENWKREWEGKVIFSNLRPAVEWCSCSSKSHVVEEKMKGSLMVVRAKY